MENFGEWLKDEIMRQGITQRDVVAKTGKTEAHISKIIHGTVIPSWGTISMIVEAMGCEIEIRKKDEGDGKVHEGKKLTIRDELKEITDTICSDYCKWPEKMKEKNRNDPEEAEDELLERYCAKCPLNRIS